MNEDIIKSKIKRKGVYFQINYKIEGEKFTYSKVNEKNVGLKAFNSQIKEVESLTTDSIEVELYSFAIKKIKTAPDEVLIWKNSEKKKQKHEFRGFGDLGALGGIENYIHTAVTANTAVDRVEFLKDENEKLAQKVSAQEKTIEALKQDKEKTIETLKQENWLYFKEIENIKSSLISAEKEKDNEIQRIKNQNSSLQNYLPAIGTIAARIMGLNGEQMRGLLGIPDDDTEQIASAPSNNENAPKFSFKKDEAPSVISNDEIITKILSLAEQKTAEIMITEITDMLSNLLKANESKYIKQLYKIFAFSTSNDDNLNLVADLIFKK